MTNILYRAHTCACSTGKALSGSPFARWMDKVLSAGARKRADELLKARAAYSAAKAAYDAALGITPGNGAALTGLARHALVKNDTATA